MTGLRIGLLRLLDSAPLLAAQAHGLFAGQGIAAELSVEPSWANLLDKLAYGVLDAAVLPGSLALAAALGLRGPVARIAVPIGLSRGGNGIVVAPAAAAALDGGDRAPLALGRRFVAWLATQAEPPPVAVVHALSTHALLLRYWLAASGADPDRALHIAVVPPEQVVPALAAGRIAGFCAGAPWAGVAERAGAGRALLGGSAIWAGHPEKVLALSLDWIAAHQAAVTPLLRGLLRAGRWCDTADNADAVAALLAERLSLDPQECRAALPGGGGLETVRFAAGAAWFPWPSQAAWFAGQLARWGWLAPEQAARAAQVYRPDLLRAAVAAEALAWPAAQEKIEGEHSGPWLCAADPYPLEMCADTFVDDARFSLNGRQMPARTTVTWAMD